MSALAIMIELTSNSLSLNIELPNNLLGLELFTLGRRSVGEWEFLLVALDLVDPFCSVDRFKLGYEFGEGSDDISENGNLGLDDLVDVLGLDLEVDDTSSSF
jgi:hypothetical protein